MSTKKAFEVEFCKKKPLKKISLSKNMLIIQFFSRNAHSTVQY